jgi:hypothetical protein
LTELQKSQSNFATQSRIGNESITSGIEVQEICKFIQKWRFVAQLANLNGCQIIMIDGPQAWKHPHNGHAYQRDCERKLNTPAKIGLLLYVGLLFISNKYTIQHISLNQVRN